MLHTYLNRSKNVKNKCSVDILCLGVFMRVEETVSITFKNIFNLTLFIWSSVLLIAFFWAIFTSVGMLSLPAVETIAWMWLMLHSRIFFVQQGSFGWALVSHGAAAVDRQSCLIFITDALHDTALLFISAWDWY